MISKKEYIAMLPTLALIEIRRKTMDLMKDRVPLAFKETESALDIHWKLPFQRVRNLQYQCTSVRSNKTTRS